MLHNYCQKLFDLLAEKRKIVPSPSQMQFFSSLWLAHQPFGTVYSRKFHAAEGEGFQAFLLQEQSQHHAKPGPIWLGVTRSWESSKKIVVGGGEVSRTCVLVKVIFGRARGDRLHFQEPPTALLPSPGSSLKFGLQSLPLRVCPSVHAWKTSPFPALRALRSSSSSAIPPSSRETLLWGAAQGQGGQGKHRIKKNDKSCILGHQILGVPQSVLGHLFNSLLVVVYY